MSNWHKSGITCPLYYWAVYAPRVMVRVKGER